MGLPTSFDLPPIVLDAGPYAPDGRMCVQSSRGIVEIDVVHVSTTEMGLGSFRHDGEVRLVSLAGEARTATPVPWHVVERNGEHGRPTVGALPFETLDVVILIEQIVRDEVRARYALRPEAVARGLDRRVDVARHVAEVERLIGRAERALHDLRRRGHGSRAAEDAVAELSRFVRDLSRERSAADCRCVLCVGAMIEMAVAEKAASAAGVGE